MNARTRTGLSLLAITGAFALGCDDQRPDESTALPPDTATAEDVRRETGEAAHAAGAWTEARRDEFVAAAQAQYDALEEDLAALAAEAEAAGEAARERFNQVRATLATQLQVVERRLDSARGATASTWSQVQSDFTTAVNDVKAAFAEARRSIVGNPPPQPPQR